MDWKQAHDEWKSLIEQSRAIATRKRELRAIIKRLDPPPRYVKRGKWSGPYIERNQEIARLYGTGMKLQEIGDIYGISRERVRQLLKSRGVKPRPVQKETPCKTDGCNRSANGALGYCAKHYTRLRHKGSVDDPVFKIRTQQCSVEGCDNPYSSTGLCKNHRVNLSINMREGNVTDMNDYLNVQKAKRMMGAQKAKFSEIRAFMLQNSEHFQ